MAFGKFTNSLLSKNLSENNDSVSVCNKYSAALQSKHIINILDTLRQLEMFWVRTNQIHF